MSYAQKIEELIAERDELRAELERLRADMEFYRNFAAEVLAVKRLPMPHDMEAMCRTAYENQYHKVKADMGYDEWRLVWIRAIAAHEAAPPAQPAEAQQNPVAWRHSKTGRLSDLEEEVPLADGDEWAEPLYATPATQQAPEAWRQWSTKLHDWDYSTNRGDLRSDTPADPLFVAAAQPVPLTDEQRNDCIEAWSSKGWGDRLGEVVRICIAIERAHGIAAAGDKP